MLSQIEHPTTSVRSCLREEEKNVSGWDRDRVIIHVVNNTVVAYRKKIGKKFWIIRKYIYLFSLLSTSLRNLLIFNMYSFLSMHCTRLYLVKVNAIPLNFWLIIFSYVWDSFCLSWSRRNTFRQRIDTSCFLLSTCSSAWALGEHFIPGHFWREMHLL